MYKTEETKSIELFAAIEKRDIKEVVRLINAEADVNAVDKNGNTPLHLAIYNVNLEIVKILLQNGTDVNAKDIHGRTPLHYAANNGFTNVVGPLIRAGANVDIGGFYGMTPLHEAIEHNHAKTVRALIEGGANIYVADELNRMPFYQAVKNSFATSVKVMIEEGIDINRVNVSYMTPFFYISEYFGADTCKTILSHIAKLEAASLYVDSRNLKEKDKRISASSERYNDYSQQLQNCNEEIKRLKRENRALYDFLKESDIAKLVSIFEKNEGVRSILDDKKGLRKQYSEYAYILISKTNEVKKEIFLHNHKPLIDVLSKNYEKDFQKMSFVGIRNFFDVHRNDYRVKDRSISLINFVDLEDIATRNVPKLKVRALVEEVKNKVINSNLECPSTEQPQELNRAFN